MANSDELPIACTLSAEQLRQRRDVLLPGLIQQAVEVTEIETGLRMRFNTRPGLLSEIVAIIEQERECCTFLRFSLTAEPGGGAITLEVTGSPGTLELLRSL